MAQLAIKGHLTRDKEVIEILEMLGANNANNCYGKYCDRVYYINENGYIDQDFISHIEQDIKFIIFTLEEFLEKFPYKVGDKVKNIYGAYGKVYVIKWIDNEVQYRLDFGHRTSGWYEANELQPYKEQENMEKKETSVVVNNEHKQLKVHSLRYDKVQLMIDDKYELKQEGDVYYIVRKKPQYPKNYEECCDILQLEHTFDLNDLTIEEESLIKSFIRFKRCRDAYWKIAGEQMGLGKPWEPDWKSETETYYTISYDGVNIKCYNNTDVYSKLAFPTEEMRDAFYENFKKLIETCKELL